MCGGFLVVMLNTLFWAGLFAAGGAPAHIVLMVAVIVFGVTAGALILLGSGDDD